MATTTMGVKLDDTTRVRIKRAAQKIDCTPHWLIKQAIFSYLSNIEKENFSADTGSELPVHADNAGYDSQIFPPDHGFTELPVAQSMNRTAITSACRCPEAIAISSLLEHARLSPALKEKTQQLAYQLTDHIRQRKGTAGRSGMVQELLQEFSLSSQEGVALMCLAEALLRIPDNNTRNALIRDKISHGNWQSHLGRSPSLFVNATTWGLLLTGRLVSTHSETRLSHTLNRIICKSGEPLVRKGVDMAMRLMGQQFVTGETITEALSTARRMEDRGFRYSYDMLGEAALTASSAEAYLLAYQQAIHAIGSASNGRGIYEGPGISIKLSALHPRYCRQQYQRVLDELYPLLKSLVQLARSYDIGINIDAEEADRLELSLDLLEKLCFEPDLAGWNGIGFVIQAYMKRCPFVIDFLLELAQRSQHRLMIRLVKGAYWDSEIKRAQQEGLEGYPVYTRKIYTDIAYLACARKLLSAPNLIYPQFATHNAHTLAAIYQLAGHNFYPGQYEFQCLHGMGEPLYEQVVGKTSEGKLNRPCRIYAPVGTHETLLAYLVRRLLENGANTSFVNRIADSNLPVKDLITDPVEAAEKLATEEGAIGLPHPEIPLPRQLYGSSRINSSGLDLSSEHCLAMLSDALRQNMRQGWLAHPIINAVTTSGRVYPVINPAEPEDIVGEAREASEQEVSAALEAAVHAAPVWFSTPPQLRASVLEHGATLMEEQKMTLMGLLVREAGKTYSNAIAEVREAVDFLRYYAHQIRDSFDNETHLPLGPVVCISPWNFPLAIFTGQIAAALAAGNSVLAKPAEQTPLIAALAVKILLEAGIPHGVLQLLPGRGETVGAQLAADERIGGVMFTGSTAVARLLQRTIAGRLNPQGNLVPLIAETGGINAMIVDSSALTEQVVTDVIASAFDSAGQRCSALRLLCLQQEIAEQTLTMLRGAMDEYHTDNPRWLSSDTGPVIDSTAKSRIETHVLTLRDKGKSVYQTVQHSREVTRGTFVVPTLIELNAVEELNEEVFGPVLHVVRFKREDLPALLAQINASGYGLTLGVHSRIDETIQQVIHTARVGNLYVNRNMVGAVVGVQPFGGEGMSGTGPKAGGPLYLYRLLSRRPAEALRATLQRLNAESADDRFDVPPTSFSAYHTLSDWAADKPRLAALCQRYAEQTVAGTHYLLAGPTGERNSLMLQPRERVLCLTDHDDDRLIQLAAVISCGCRVLWPQQPRYRELFHTLPAEIQHLIDFTTDYMNSPLTFDAVIFHGDSEQLRVLSVSIASLGGPLISVQGFAQGETDLLLERLLVERAVSINTAAAGGNASLMATG